MASLELQLKMVEMVRDGLLSKTTIIKNNNAVGNQARCSCEGTILLDLYTSRTMFGLVFFLAEVTHGGSSGWRAF